MAARRRKVSLLAERSSPPRALAAPFGDVCGKKGYRAFHLILAMSRHDSTKLHYGSMDVERESMRLLPGD